MSSNSAKRKFHQRLFCVPASPLSAKTEGWSFDDGRLRVDLSALPELKQKDSAVRFESEALPDRILLVHGVDGSFRAYSNHCACGGFRVDPVPGEEKIRCCTLMQSTYDYDGKFLKGTANKDLTVYSVLVEGEKLTIKVPLE